MRLLKLALIGTALATPLAGCSIAVSVVVSAVYRKDVRAEDEHQDDTPWVGHDRRAERWVVERFDLVRAETRDLDDTYWKFPGDFSRVSYRALARKIDRFGPRPDPEDPRDPGDLLDTVVCLRPVVVLVTRNPDHFPTWRYPIAVRTWAAFDPEIRWFSPDLDAHPMPPTFDAPDRAHIEVPWGRLALTREPVPNEHPGARADDIAGHRWTVTTERLPYPTD